MGCFSRNFCVATPRFSEKSISNRPVIIVRVLRFSLPNCTRHGVRGALFPHLPHIFTGFEGYYPPRASCLPLSISSICFPGSRGGSISRRCDDKTRPDTKGKRQDKTGHAQMLTSGRGVDTRKRRQRQDKK